MVVKKMTEKRFTHKKWLDDRQLFDGDEPFAIVDVYIQAEAICNKLNELYNENQQLKSILQDMGLIMSNEEVKNVRDEIASKLIKPLCEGNGFDVDVNTENGFTIIPKEVNNDRE